LSISVRLRNLVRGGLGPIRAVSVIEWMDGIVVSKEEYLTVEHISANRIHITKNYYKFTKQRVSDWFVSSLGCPLINYYSYSLQAFLAV
jgi:hypothetical protein